MLYTVADMAGNVLPNVGIVSGAVSGRGVRTLGGVVSGRGTRTLGGLGEGLGFFMPAMPGLMGAGFGQAAPPPRHKKRRKKRHPATAIDANVPGGIIELPAAVRAQAQTNATFVVERSGMPIGVFPSALEAVQLAKATSKDGTEVTIKVGGTPIAGYKGGDKSFSTLDGSLGMFINPIFGAAKSASQCAKCGFGEPLRRGVAKSLSDFGIARRSTLGPRGYANLGRARRENFAIGACAGPCFEPPLGAVAAHIMSSRAPMPARSFVAPAHRNPPNVGARARIHYLSPLATMTYL